MRFEVGRRLWACPTPHRSSALTRDSEKGALRQRTHRLILLITFLLLVSTGAAGFSKTAIRMCWTLL